jgi:hypothetical protein
MKRAPLIVTGDAKMLALVSPSTTASRPQDPMGRFLAHHFGDGLVYLMDDDDDALFAQACSCGLVTGEGYLTRSGYQYWRHFDD